ncbi:hypothetical protein JXI42_07870 [bacterium]|nr:hypothetical protein [bacterium]
MATKRIKIYWFQFVIAAIWVGAIEAVLPYSMYPELRTFIINCLIVLTGIIAFEPVSKHIWKYVAISIVASLLIGVLREVGLWYMRSGLTLKRIGGPIITLIIITLILYLIAKATQKDKFRL